MLQRDPVVALILPGLRGSGRAVVQPIQVVCL